MKAISIKQPWADFICAGKKSIEIRSWSTKYRGALLIHASKKIDKQACLYYSIEPSSLYVGGIIGVATLQDVIGTKDLEVVWDNIRDITMETGEYKDGLVGWAMMFPQFLENPIECRGKLGVFDYDENF